MDAKAYDSKTAAFAGYLIQNVPSLTDTEMNHWLEDPAAMKRFLLSLKVDEQVASPLLEEVGTPIELAAVEHFVSRERFVVGTSGEVPIMGFGSNFRAHFLDVVENNVQATVLKQRKLLKASVDAPILEELGDADLTKIEKARVALAHTFGFLKVADRSGSYMFYVADAKGTVWAVCASWIGDGWSLGADSVENPDRCRAVGRVVSR